MITIEYLLREIFKNVSKMTTYNIIKTQITISGFKYGQMVIKFESARTKQSYGQIQHVHAPFLTLNTIMRSLNTINYQVLHMWDVLSCAGIQSNTQVCSIIKAGCRLQDKQGLVSGGQYWTLLIYVAQLVQKREFHPRVIGVFIPEVPCNGIEPRRTAVQPHILSSLYIV